MEGTPQLLTDVKFTQLRKGGYDPEEVDNYLERINEAVAKLADNLRSATERAESAQSQLADARRAQAEAEAELEVIRSGEGGAPADEQLAKVLVLAQRAADQAIDEANAVGHQDAGRRPSQVGQPVGRGRAGARAPAGQGPQEGRRRRRRTGADLADPGHRARDGARTTWPSTSRPSRASSTTSATGCATESSRSAAPSTSRRDCGWPPPPSSAIRPSPCSSWPATVKH